MAMRAMTVSVATAMAMIFTAMTIAGAAPQGDGPLEQTKVQLRAWPGARERSDLSIGRPQPGHDAQRDELGTNNNIMFYKNQRVE